jgi:hypothetical protein
MLISAENSELKKKSETLTAELKKYRKHDMSLWFPIEDILFKENGFFEEQNSKRQGQGIWINSDSELQLRAMGFSSQELFLETNLSPPGNKIRLKRGDMILVAMEKWEYQVTLLPSMYETLFYLRVERRSKI